MAGQDEHGTTTLITGASSGIGASLAKRLARRGDRVVLLARNRDALEAVAADIRSAGGHADVLVVDVTDRPAMLTAVQAFEQSHGPINRLIANAGGGERTRIDSFDAEGIEATITLNLMGVVNAVACVLPGMRARGAGQLVAMGSLAGSRGLPSAAAYSAAKAGVVNFMESLRIDLRGSGIAVTLLVPGFVATKPGKRKRFAMDLETATAGMEQAILARRAQWAAPALLSTTAAILRLLPAAGYDWLLSGRSKRS